MRWLVVIGVLGCGSRPVDKPSPAPIANTPSRTDVVSRLADARAFELGTRGTRDYRQAAAIYDELCAEGCGHRDACRELIDLAVHERGTVMTPARTVIPARLCDRGDQVACWVAGLFGVRPASAFTANLTELCAAGDAKACEADAMFDFGDEGKVLARTRPLAACRASVAEGCASLFAGLWPYCSARNTQPGTPCIQQRAEEWRAEGGDPSPLLDAWQKAQRLCAHGDAVACDWVPGQELDELARCTAGDFAVCRSLANRGDARARPIACTGGITELCVPSRPQPSIGAREAMAEQEMCNKGDVAACKAAAKRTEIPSCPI